MKGVKKECSHYETLASCCRRNDHRHIIPRDFLGDGMAKVPERDLAGHPGREGIGNVVRSEWRGHPGFHGAGETVASIHEAFHGREKHYARNIIRVRGSGVSGNVGVEIMIMIYIIQCLTERSIFVRQNHLPPTRHCVFG